MLRSRLISFPGAFGLAALLLLCGYAYGVWRGIVPLYPLALVYGVMSLIAVAVYRHDKRAAIANEWRVSEALLHALELFGGWPGALVAQHLFRHKVKKLSYQIVFWMIVAFHGAAWYTMSNAAVLSRVKGLLPQSVASLLTKAAQMNVNTLVPAALLEQGRRPLTQPAAGTEPESACAPLEEVWASDPATEPVIDAPGLRRSRAVALKHCRRLTGEVKAVSPSQGLLIVLPPDIGGDGVIAPATLISDFHRRFRVGEKLAVAVKGVSMKGSRKQVELLLVEP